MKKIILLFTAVSLFFNLYAVNTGAAPSNPVVAKYDSANTALFVNADFGNTNADVLTTMTLFKSGETLSDGSLPMLFQTEFTNDNGIINVSIPIPSFFTSDKYTVRVANIVGTYDADFLYAKNSDIRDVMILLNGAQTEGEISGIITSNYQNLALDPVVVSPYVSELSKAYKTICSQTDYTNETVFYSDFMQCLAAAEIACGNDTESVLNNYKLYIGSSIDEMRAYPSSVKSLLISYIGDSSYSDGLLSEQIPSLRVLAFFKSSSTWGEAKLNILGTDSSGTKYIDNFDVLSPSLTHYSQVDNINLVYEKIFSQRASITSFEKLKTVFESSAKAVYEDETKKPVQNNNSSPSGHSVPSASVKPGTSPEVVSPNSRFNDINGHWAQKQIEELANKNVISGYPDGSFAPNNNVTRAEFAKMIISFAGLSGQSDTMSFEDVNSSDWFFSSVSSAVYHGLINGISEMHFAPNTEMTRQDACVIIYRYLVEKITDAVDNEGENAKRVYLCTNSGHKIFYLPQKTISKYFIPAPGDVIGYGVKNGDTLTYLAKVFDFATYEVAARYADEASDNGIATGFVYSINGGYIHYFPAEMQTPGKPVVPDTIDNTQMRNSNYSASTIIHIDAVRSSDGTRVESISVNINPETKMKDVKTAGKNNASFVVNRLTYNSSSEIYSYNISYK